MGQQASRTSARRPGPPHATGSDASVRRAAWAMPTVYVGVTVTSLALAQANGRTLAPDLQAIPVFFLYTVIGALVASREPRNAVGWLVGAAGLFAIVTFLAAQYSLYATVTAPGSLPGGGVAAWLSLWLWMGILASLLYAVLLFPSGRLPSRRWSPVALAAGTILGLVTAIFAFGTPASEDAVPLANPFFIPALAPLYAIVGAGFIVFVVLLGLAVASLVARFRRSRGVERQQLKWIVVAGMTMVAALASGLLWESGLVWLVSFLALPVSIAIAILRHRLYDIDVLINRALVYGALSASLLATYAATVLALSALVRPVTGSSDVAVAGSTLAVVALFAPLRARIQRIVDRRFYRSRYDSARTIERFGARLRDNIDLEQLSVELVGVAHETVRPAHASLWLRGRGA